MAEISEAVLARARKLQEKEELKAEKIRESLSRHPHADPDTLVFDPTANKYSVEIACVECGEKRRVYTSDLHQVKHCTKCSAIKKIEARKVKKEELKAALDFLKKQGKI